MNAHRVAWQLAHGPIPRGLCVLHRCDNPPCVNPDHLFLGTRNDNTQDSMAKGRHTAWHASGVRLNGAPVKKRLCQTHCKHGHELAGSNLILHGPGAKWRLCRLCAQVRARRYYAAKKGRLQRVTAGTQDGHLFGQGQQQVRGAEV